MSNNTELPGVGEDVSFKEIVQVLDNYLGCLHKLNAFPQDLEKYVQRKLPKAYKTYLNDMEELKQQTPEKPYLLDKLDEPEPVGEYNWKSQLYLDYAERVTVIFGCAWVVVMWGIGKLISLIDDSFNIWHVLLLCSVGFICLICVVVRIIKRLIKGNSDHKEAEKRYNKEKEEAKQAREDYKRDLEKYKIQIEQINAKEKRLNEEWNLYVSGFNEEYQKKKNRLKTCLAEASYQKKQVISYLPPKYQDNQSIEEIVSIFNDKRADNLQDTINILVSDRNAAELQRLERQRIQRIEEQREREREREWEVESAARAQCEHCARYYQCSFCQYNKGNCAAYIPR